VLGAVREEVREVGQRRLTPGRSTPSSATGDHEVVLLPGARHVTPCTPSIERFGYAQSATSSSHFGITRSASTSWPFAERRRFVAVPTAGSPPCASGLKLAEPVDLDPRGVYGGVVRVGLYRGPEVLFGEGRGAGRE
jgi:hypothetical protein